MTTLPLSVETVQVPAGLSVTPNIAVGSGAGSFVKTPGTATSTLVSRLVPVKLVTAVPRVLLVIPLMIALVASPCETTAAFDSSVMLVASAAELLLATTMLVTLLMTLVISAPGALLCTTSVMTAASVRSTVASLPPVATAVLMLLASAAATSLPASCTLMPVVVAMALPTCVITFMICRAIVCTANAMALSSALAVLLARSSRGLYDSRLISTGRSRPC